MKTLITTLLLAFIALSVSGQTKIGSITISDNVANKYFLDCYRHPDTLTREYVDGCGDAMEKEVKVYNEWLSYASIKHIVVHIKHPAEIDTIKKFMTISGTSYNCPFGSIKHEKPYFSPTTHVPVKGYKGHEKEFEIVNEPEWVESVEIGFEVPRKPTEIDFIKWLAKQR
jgi:hypothetical protein